MSINRKVKSIVRCTLAFWLGFYAKCTLETMSFEPITSKLEKTVIEQKYKTPEVNKPKDDFYTLNSIISKIDTTDTEEFKMFTENNGTIKFYNENMVKELDSVMKQTN
jgi:hypothetical protein